MNETLEPRPLGETYGRDYERNERADDEEPAYYQDARTTTVRGRTRCEQLDKPQ
jgi:hypothetical protein